MPVQAQRSRAIIPYQELLGNYNPDGDSANAVPVIIPYQELLGNYNFNDDAIIGVPAFFIPYQELLGNYNLQCVRPQVRRPGLYHTKNC